MGQEHLGWGQGLRETGKRAAAQSLLCDLKLSKSGPEAHPTHKTKALQVSDSPFLEAVNSHLLLTKHGPWCDLTSSPQERRYMAQLPLLCNSAFMSLNTYTLAGLWQIPTATFPLYKYLIITENFHSTFSPSFSSMKNPSAFHLTSCVCFSQSASACRISGLNPG